MNIKSNILAICFLLASVIALSGRPAFGETDITFDSGNTGVRWLPGYYGDSSLRFFLNQDGDLEKHRYVTEGIVSIEYIILSKAERLRLLWEITLATGMGESVAKNLPFSPLEMYYSLKPFFEYQPQNLIYRLGWDHASYHLIYKDNASPWYENEGPDIEPDVYHNRVFAGIGSPAIRRKIQRKKILRNKPDSALHRLTWYFEAGHYVQSLGGLMDSDSISGGHDWRWDLVLELRYPLLIRRSAAVFANNKTITLIDGENDAYWRDRIELELMMLDGQFGTSFFAGINIADEHPRDSREGIADLGFRFFF